MKKFPDKLNPNNLKLFKKYNKERQICYVRRYIYEKMLSDDFTIPDNCSIDLQKLNIGDLGEIHYKIDPEIISRVQKELETLGWCTTLAYGGTVLFIYTKDDKPVELVSTNSFE